MTPRPIPAAHYSGLPTRCRVAIPPRRLAALTEAQYLAAVDLGPTGDDFVDDYGDALCASAVEAASSDIPADSWSRALGIIDLENLRRSCLAITSRRRDIQLWVTGENWHGRPLRRP